MKILMVPALLLLGGFCTLEGPACDARRDVALDDGRAQLPAFLPGSTHDLHAVLDPGPAASHGGFAFSDTDAGAFFARLSLDVPARAPYDNWPRILDQYRNSGHVAWSYRQEGTIWVFFCHPAKDACEYLSWTSRQWRRERPASAKQADAGHRPQ